MCPVFQCQCLPFTTGLSETGRPWLTGPIFSLHIRQPVTSGLTLREGPLVHQASRPTQRDTIPSEIEFFRDPDSTHVLLAADILSVPIGALRHRIQVLGNAWRALPLSRFGESGSARRCTLCGPACSPEAKLHTLSEPPCTSLLLHRT